MPTISQSRFPAVRRGPPKSLAASLLRVVLAIYLSLAILLTLGQLALEYQNERRRLTEEIENAATIFSPIISQALWNVDNEQIKASLLGVLGINYDVLNVQLLDQKGLLLYEFDSPADKHTFSGSWAWAGQLADLFLERYLYEYDLFYESDFTTNRKIGQLILKSNSNVVLSRAAHTFLITIISAIFKTSLLAGIFYVIMRRMVGAPLKQVTYAMQQLDSDHRRDELSKDFEPELLRRDDELGAMVRTFKEMAHSLKQKDRAISAHSSRLEAKVRERTRQLEQASQAKSDFLASVSHEIRTPMNGVIGLAHLLGETQLTTQQRHYVDVIQSSGQSLIHIINEILDHLKIESNKIELENTVFNLEELFNGCIDLFSHCAREANIGVAAMFSPRCPQYAVGDPTRVRQILVNLLGNAFKFTKAGSITVKADVEEGDTEEAKRALFWITVSITDTGIGIEQSQLHRLFKPFSQADSSTTRRYGGTGLGLAICKQLTELMGGSIGVASTVGEGSRFWFKIPLKLRPQNGGDRPSIHLHTDTQASLLLASARYEHHLRQLLDSQGLRATVFLQREPFLQHLSVAAGGILAIIECRSGGCGRGHARCSELLDKIRSQSQVPILLIGGQDYGIKGGLAERHEKVCILHAPFTNQAFLHAAAELLTGTPKTDKPKALPREQRDLSVLNVLVAEDNPVNQMVIMGYLQQYSIEPVVVENGKQVLEYCQGSLNAVDLILMDGEMPELDGWQTAKIIRSMGIKNRSGLPVNIVAFSAHAMEAYQEKAAEYGMNGFLSKPINHLELKTILLAAYEALPPRDKVNSLADVR